MMSKIRESKSWERAVIAALFLVGILLRVRQYLAGRSLWADEAMLALNIVNRNMRGLFQALEYDQGAPIGFLLVEKIFNLLLGRNEYALRLFPLLAGILAIWLFYLLSQRVTRNAGLLSALSLFVFNPRLVYYSAEGKQYIVDVVMCIVLLLAASPLLEGRYQRKHFGWLAAAGFVALWFSHPAVFVLAGIGLTLLIVSLRRQQYSTARSLLGMAILWLSTIAFLYFLTLDDIQKNAYMQEYWQGAFLPWPPWSEPGWFHRSLTENIGLQFGIPYAVYPVFVLMLAGWVLLLKTQQTYALALGWILLVTLTASAMGLYPIFERMILFVLPIGILLLGKSIEYLGQQLQSLRPGRFITIAAAGFLLFGPVVTSVNYFIEPKYFEHIRPAMQFLEDTRREGDVLFVTHGAVPAFEYYAPLYEMSDIPYLSSSRQDYQQPQRILEQFRPILGERRVWVLMSHVYERGDFNERNFILDYLKENGTRRREFRRPGTSVYLYLFDLGN